MTESIYIDERKIGKGSPVFIVAELSANHNQKLDIAIETIKAAKRAGADAIKLQTYTPDSITMNIRSDDFKVRQGTIWDGKYLYDLYKEAYTPWEWHEELFRIAREEGLICFSSPFDREAVDLLEELNCGAYKIASFEITDIPLIDYIASKNKPVIISTGIAGEEDIILALDTCHNRGNENLALLKCTSSYPAPLEEVNAVMIRDLSERFGMVSGISDHTMGITVPVAATVLGAKIIEKHFILDRSIGGPDSSFSLNKEEFSEMTAAVREAEKVVGEVNYALTPSQLKNRDFSRSLFVVRDVKAGELVSIANIRSVRPGFGLHPRYLNDIIGKKFLVDVNRGTPLRMEYLDT